MDDALLKKMARTFLAHSGEVYIDKRLASDIAMLAKRIREGDKVTVAEIDVVLDELSLVDPEWEAKVMLEDALT